MKSKSITRSFVFLLLVLLYSLQQMSWAKEIPIYTGSPYYIDSKRILYFNIPQPSEGIIAAQLDLDQIFPQISTEILKQKTYQFKKNQIQIISYQGPPIKINLTSDEENNEILKANYYQFFKGQERTLLKPLNLRSRFISFETLEQFDQNFNVKSQDWLGKNLSAEPYMLNRLMFYAAINRFDDMNEFMQNLIKNLTQSQDVNDYKKAKALYLQYLIENTEFNDIDLIMATIEHHDLDFLNNMRLRQLNQIVIDEIEPYTFYFTMCSPLGKAIRLNQFQTVALLLNKGASIEKVCISKFNEQQSALEVAKKYKNKRVLKLIESYLNEP
ncbi:hypothetical protein I5729_18125 [Acinetobacter bereziniae]|uniref:hypothetical protein n=1 Tax=Acinetobacter bereziniae TaxID=106648 RepID=UPI001901BC50|nr:hypothetical protein [Acinetobacter bereziniae]MBJ9951004.1 hypothetical protein [Acinetobacter bereziniae]